VLIFAIMIGATDLSIMDKSIANTSGIEKFRCEYRYSVYHANEARAIHADDKIYFAADVLWTRDGKRIAEHLVEKVNTSNPDAPMSKVPNSKNLVLGEPNWTDTGGTLSSPDRSIGYSLKGKMAGVERRPIRQHFSLIPFFQVRELRSKKNSADLVHTLAVTIAAAKDSERDQIVTHLEKDDWIITIKKVKTIERYAFAQKWGYLLREVSYTRMDGTAKSETKVVLLAAQQLPSGRWFPTHRIWCNKATPKDKDWLCRESKVTSLKEEIAESDFRLKIPAGTQLGTSEDFIAGITLKDELDVTLDDIDSLMDQMKESEGTAKANVRTEVRVGNRNGLYLGIAGGIACTVGTVLLLRRKRRAAVAAV
jgi:hypothetical protein